MIGLILSYRKSAAVFCTMTVLVVAAAVLLCLSAPDGVSLTLRLVGLCVLLIAVYAEGVAHSLKLLAAEIDRVGGAECACERLGARLRALSRRTFVGSVKGAILLQYAYTQIYRGDYGGAMLSVSNAVIAGKDRIKGDAAVCFCEIFYMQADAEYFGKYIQKATQTLRAYAQEKSATVRATAAVRLIALSAMQADLSGDKAEALRRIRDFVPDDAPLLQQKNLAALSEHIAEKGTA